MAVQPQPTDSSPQTGLRPRFSDTLAGFRRSVLRRPVSIASWTLVVLFVLMAVLAPVLAPYDPTVRGTGAPMLAPFSKGHLLGTDEFGRDQLSRILFGARPLIVTSLAASATAAGLGFAIGIISGYAGGFVDTLLMRAMDAVLSFPLILLAIMIVAALGPSLRNLVLAIGISQVPVFARLVRAMVAAEASKEYILAARASGFGTPRILLGEITPNVVGPTIVQATSVVAVAAGYAAALSYLGLGIQPPTPDWGYMTKEGQEFLFIAPDLSLIPGLLITAFVTAVNFVGDDLRDLLDPNRAL